MEILPHFGLGHPRLWRPQKGEQVCWTSSPGILRRDLDRRKVTEMKPNQI